MRRMAIVVIVAIVGVYAVFRHMRRRMPACPKMLLVRQVDWRVEHTQSQHEQHEQDR